jgi:hypothetical protein
LLIDYAASAGIVPKVFDTQFPAGDLSRFCPEAAIVDLTATAGQMQVFDQLAPLTIVDVAGGVLSRTVGLLDRVKILADAQAGRIKIVLLHVLGSSFASLAEVMAMQAHLPAGVTLLLVKNDQSAGQYAGWEGDTRFAAALANAQVVEIPNLDATATSAVQLAGGSFAGFAANASQSRLLRGHVSAWLDDVFAGFDRAGLKSVMSNGV